MNKVYALNEIQEIIAPILQSHGVNRAYLFGSYARGDATENSDIDLRIDSGRIKFRKRPNQNKIRIFKN